MQVTTSTDAFIKEDDPSWHKLKPLKSTMWINKLRTQHNMTKIEPPLFI